MPNIMENLKDSAKNHRHPDTEQSEKQPLPYAKSAYRGQGPTKSAKLREYWLNMGWNQAPSSFHVIDCTRSSLQPISLTIYSRSLWCGFFWFCIVVVGLPMGVFGYAESNTLKLALAPIIILVSAICLYKINFYRHPRFKFDRLTGKAYYYKRRETKVCHFSELTPVRADEASTRLFFIWGDGTQTKCVFDDYKLPIILSLQWWFIEAFMDTSRPLPEKVYLEHLRPYDPTTTEWDQANQRPPHLLRDMSSEVYNHLMACVEDYKKKVAAPNFVGAVNDKIWQFLPSEMYGLEPDLWPVVETNYYNNNLKIIEEPQKPTRKLSRRDRKRKKKQ